MTKKLMFTLGVIGLTFGGTALAQTAPAQDPAMQAMPATAQQVDVSDEQLKAFSEVHKEVVAVSNNYQTQLQATNTPEEAAEISQKANNELTKVVENSPLSVNEYNQIAMLLQQDQELMQKYQNYAQ